MLHHLTNSSDEFTKGHAEDLRKENLDRFSNIPNLPLDGISLFVKYSQRIYLLYRVWKMGDMYTLLAV